MGKFLNPFTDVGFKKLFGQEVNKETDGTRFIVELQNQYQDYFFDRGLYYLCRMNPAKK